MTGIPTSVAAFTTDWLEASLGAPSGSLNAFEVKPVGAGQVADSHRLTLHWQGHAGPASLIAKTPSLDPQSLNTGVTGELYLREVSWYRDLAPQSRVNCPKAYASVIEGKGEVFALLLEDCAPGAQGDQLAGAGEDDVTTALLEAAALHAGLLNDATLHERSWLNYDRKMRDQKIALYGYVWPEFRKRLADRLEPAILEMGDRFAAVFDRYINREPDVFTVTHNDLRVDNILFGSPGGRAVVLDWQTLAIDHPMVDVSYLIGTSIADPDQRSAQEERLVRGYLSALASNGASLGWDEAWKGYRLYALSGFAMAVISLMLVKRTERGDEMFAVMAERSARQALHLDSLSLI